MNTKELIETLRQAANNNMDNIELGHLLMLAADKIEESTWPSVDPKGVEKRTAKRCCEIAKAYDGVNYGAGHRVAYSIECKFGLEGENW
jgi:hypothetical protein